MTIIRWNMRPDMEKYIGRPLRTTPSGNDTANGKFLPQTNIRRNGDHYRIDMAAPGRNKEEFSIKLEEDLLSISYKKKEAEIPTEENGKYLRKEFDTTPFTRHFTLPETTDKEKISAKYENGILSVNIPFEEPDQTKISKTINVN